MTDTIFIYCLFLAEEMEIAHELEDLCVKVQSSSEDESFILSMFALFYYAGTINLLEE